MLNKILVISIAFFCTGFSVFTQTKKLDSLLTSLLKDYVKNGMVDYENLKGDERLDEYIEGISKVDPNQISSEKSKLAFWINAYNAYTLKIVCDNYPIESINDLNNGGRIISHIIGTTVWDKKLVTINNKEITLNNIEHDIIRKEFNEPRIHFALVCAAISCPQLRNEAFTGERIDRQLLDQAEKFLNDPAKNSFDLKNKTAYLSKIFDWYQNDFGDNEKDVLLYISRFLSGSNKENLLKNISEWEINYKDYNWSLNIYKK